MTARPGLLTAGCTLAALAALWVAPISPLAMSQADLALGRGRPEVAAARYDAVARWTPFRATRAEALRRAAAVYEAELGDHESARARLEQLLELPLPDAERASRLAEVGDLWAFDRKFARAANALKASVEADPDAAEAAARMVRMARAFGEANLIGKAKRQWAALADEHPPWKSRANLGLAELHLATGEIPQALSLYREVAAHGADDERAIAKLGESVCLERLGDLDQALAAIDGTDLPDGVRRSRERSLIARQAWAATPAPEPAKPSGRASGPAGSGAAAPARSAAAPSPPVRVVAQ